MRYYFLFLIFVGIMLALFGVLKLSQPRSRSHVLPDSHSLALKTQESGALSVVWADDSAALLSRTAGGFWVWHLSTQRGERLTVLEGVRDDAEIWANGKSITVGELRRQLAGEPSR